MAGDQCRATRSTVGVHGKQESKQEQGEEQQQATQPWWCQHQQEKAPTLQPLAGFPEWSLAAEITSVGQNFATEAQTVKTAMGFLGPFEMDRKLLGTGSVALSQTAPNTK